MCKRLPAFSLALLLLLSLFSCGQKETEAPPDVISDTDVVSIEAVSIEGTYAEEDILAGFFPLWMQAYSEIICDENLQCTVIKGGAIPQEELAVREDIPENMLQSRKEGLGLIPRTKAEYDLHGFIQNIYFEVPDAPGTYQLSPPQ